MTRVIWVADDPRVTPPNGILMVHTEVEFLRNVLQNSPICVSGVSLGRWAKRIALARGWECREAGHPVQDLLAVCPDLDHEQAMMIVEQLGNAVWDHSPLLPIDAAQVLWPGDLWITSPSLEHSAHWLAWLIDNDPAPVESKLLSVILSGWHSQSIDYQRSCYQADTKDQAVDVISEWIGLTGDLESETWPSFPISPIPVPVRRALSDRVRRTLIDSQGRAFERWRDQVSSLEVRHLVNREALKHFQANPIQLQDAWIDDIAVSLTISELAELRDLRPPSVPQALPEDYSSVLAWYENEYLPWREWHAHSQVTVDHDRPELGRTFGEWYLSTFPRLTQSSSDNPPVNWLRAYNLHQAQSNEIVLLIVLDGLSSYDRKTLLHAIESLVQDDVRITRNDLVLTSAPTVTELTKPALLRGLPPDQIHDEGTSQAVSRLTAVVDGLQKAQPGDLVVWRLVEPDRTYHQQQDRQQLVNDVESQLDNIARHINHIVTHTSRSYNLRIVITADHGRLLTHSTRTLPIPSGYVAHGRAAWGPASHTFSKSGYTIEGDIAVLNADLFSLPAGSDYMVPLTDASFLMKDGRGGEEWFPHGGIFPEEVFVPWIELQVQTVYRPLEVVVVGGGQAGGVGKLQLTMVNLNDFPIQVHRLRMRYGDWPSRVIDIEENVAGRDTKEVSVNVNDWPTREDVTSVSAVVVCATPSGERQTDRVTSIVLTSEMLYESDNPLKDLLS